MAKLDERSPYLAWLGCLNAVGRKIRREGLMAIELDIEFPDDPTSAFAKYPLTLRQPYLDFAHDILRLMVAGVVVNQPELIDLYSEHALAAKRWRRFWRRPDETLMTLIALVLRLLSDGQHPDIACEFGRQVIPWHSRPSFRDMEDWFRELRSERTADLSDERIDSFLNSIGASEPDSP